MKEKDYSIGTTVKVLYHEFKLPLIGCVKEIKTNGEETKPLSNRYIALIIRIISFILFGVTLLILVLSLSGCSTTDSNGLTPEEKRFSIYEEATVYLEAKYPDDTFTYVVMAANGTKNVKLTYQSEKFPEEEIIVYKEDDNTEFRDNYLYVKYREKTRDFITDIFNETLDWKCKVYLDETFVKDTLIYPGDTTFEGFMEGTRTIIGCAVIFYPGYDFESDIDLYDKLQYAFEKNNVHITAAFIYFPEEGFDYQEIEESDTMRYISIERDVPLLYAYYLGQEDVELYWREE